MEEQEIATRFFGRKFAAKVEAATKEARARFATAPNHLDRDLPDKTYWVSVLVEEVGKMARACDKLAITRDPTERAVWDKEGNHRLVQIASMARRMAERWPELSDQLKGDWHIGGDDEHSS